MEEDTMQIIESSSKVSSAVQLNEEENLEQPPKEKDDGKEKEKILNENLIAAIKFRSFIFDPNDPHHFQRKIIKNAWEEISAEVGREATFCLTRWRSLKDHFVRKYNEWRSHPELGKPTWPWFDLMSFLKQDFNIPEDKIKTKDPEPRKKLKKVRGEDKLFKSDCLFCCESIPVRKDKLGGNFRENSKIIDYFCKAWRISGDLYAGQMELAPFCRNCVGIIESVGALMESIDALKIKLSSKKNLILEMLKKEYRRDEDVEEKLYSAFAFSPSNFRQQLVELFGVSARGKGRIESGFLQDSGNRLQNPAPTSPSPTVIDSDHECDEDRDPTDPVGNLKGSLEESGKTGRIAKNLGNETSACKIPPGVVIQDCFVVLERVEVKDDKINQINRRKRQNKKRRNRKENSVITKIRNKVHPVSRDRRKQCPYCPRVLCSITSLQYHLKLHTGMKDFICESCGDGFRTSYLLLKHGIKSHGKEHPYRCDLCDAGFFTVTDLKYHGYAHSGDWPLKCKECGAGYPSKAHLERHLQHNHFGENAPLLTCKTCSKTFRSPYIFEQHEKRHTAARVHKCHLCPSAFTTKLGLGKHRIAHSDKRDFLCQLCGADFKTKKDLNNHLVNHDKRKLPFFKRNRQKNRLYANAPPVPNNTETSTEVHFNPTFQVSSQNDSTTKINPIISLPQDFIHPLPHEPSLPSKLVHSQTSTENQNFGVGIGIDTTLQSSFFGPSP